MSDFAARRTMMVDTQVRPNDVTKFPIISAMLTVRREAFVPGAQREAAYAGVNLDIGGGRVMLEPRTLAKMLDALDIQREDLALVVGCGFGYGAAVIAQMAEAVIALESDEMLAAEAQARLSSEGFDNIAVVSGPLDEGASRHGPFDVIVIEGGVQTLPEALLAQLKEGGRIGCIVMDGALGQCRIGLKRDGNVAWRFAFNAAAPLIAGFERKAEFSL